MEGVGVLGGLPKAEQVSRGNLQELSDRPPHPMTQVTISVSPRKKARRRPPNPRTPLQRRSSREKGEEDRAVVRARGKAYLATRYPRQHTRRNIDPIQARFPMGMTVGIARVGGVTDPVSVSQAPRSQHALLTGLPHRPFRPLYCLCPPGSAIHLRVWAVVEVPQQQRREAAGRAQDGRQVIQESPLVRSRIGPVGIDHIHPMARPDQMSCHDPTRRSHIPGRKHHLTRSRPSPPQDKTHPRPVASYRRTAEVNDRGRLTEGSCRIMKPAEDLPLRPAGCGVCPSFLEADKVHLLSHPAAGQLVYLNGRGEALDVERRNAQGRGLRTRRTPWWHQVRRRRPER